MNYKGYRLSCDRMSQLYRKAGMLSSKLRGMQAIMYTLKKVYNEYPEMLQTMECPIHALEYGWLTGDRNAYYVDTVDQCHSFIHSKYSLQTPAAMYETDESFMLTIPTLFKYYENTTSSGLMVEVRSNVSSENNPFNAFTAALGIDGEVQINSNLGGYTVSIAYQLDVSHEYFLLTLPDYDCLNILRCESFDEYKIFMRSQNEFNYLRGMDLSEEEFKHQFYLCRYLLGFMIYKKALPDRIKYGTPNHINPKLISTRNIQKINAYHVKSPEFSNKELTPHYRKSHFRQLMDERFYRGEFKDWPKGKRVIYVSDTYVGRHQENQTVF